MKLPDKLNKLGPKQKALFILVAPVLIAGLFVYFYYLPARNKIKTMRDSIASNQAEVEKNKVMERKLDELKQATVSLQNSLKTAQEKLPNPSGDVDFQESLKGVVGEAGLKVGKWTPAPPKADPSGLFTQTSINVEANGTYHDFGKLMETIDRMQRVLVISNLSMSSAKLEGKKMNIPVKFTITAYSAAGGK